MSKIKTALSISKPEDWYKVVRADVLKADSGIFSWLRSNKFQSFAEAVSTAYPEHAWKIWLFQIRPASWWRVPDNCLLVFATVGAELGVQTMEGWYNVTEYEFVTTCQAIKHLGRYPNCIMKQFPNHPWEPWKFVREKKRKSPNHALQPLARQRMAFDYVAAEHRLQKEDWYKVRRKDINSSEFHSILANFYRGNLPAALAAVYPEHKWHRWLFESRRSSFWNDVSEITNWARWLCRMKHVRSLSEYAGRSSISHAAHTLAWFIRLTEQDIRDNHGSGLLSYFGSITAIEQAAMRTTESNEIADPGENLRTRVHELGAELAAEITLENFYAVSPELLLKYGYVRPKQLYTELLASYPDHKWTIWEFKNVRIRLLPAMVGDLQTHVDFFEHAGRKLGVTQLSDWYNIEGKELYPLGGRKILRLYSDSLSLALLKIFPTHAWDPNQFRKRKSTSEPSLLGDATHLQQQKAAGAT